MVTAKVKIESETFAEVVLEKGGRLEDKMGPLAMHSAVVVMPPWLVKRKSNARYWHHFHKWAFAPSDPLSVLFALAVVV